MIMKKPLFVFVSSAFFLFACMHRGESSRSATATPAQSPKSSVQIASDLKSAFALYDEESKDDAPSAQKKMLDALSQAVKTQDPKGMSSYLDDEELKKLLEEMAKDGEVNSDEHYFDDSDALRQIEDAKRKNEIIYGSLLGVSTVILIACIWRYWAQPKYGIFSGADAIGGANFEALMHQNVAFAYAIETGKLDAFKKGNALELSDAQGNLKSDVKSIINDLIHNPDAEHNHKIPEGHFKLARLQVLSPELLWKPVQLDESSPISGDKQVVNRMVGFAKQGAVLHQAVQKGSKQIKNRQWWYWWGGVFAFMGAAFTAGNVAMSAMNGPDYDLGLASDKAPKLTPAQEKLFKSLSNVSLSLAVKWSSASSH